jgi:hypothetical protein
MSAPTSLIRYWFEFETDKSSTARGFPRVGVTAWTLDDAISVVSTRLFDGDPLPPTRKLVEDIDVSDLDPNHVLNQMAPPNRRGVWYPAGYEF